MQPTALIVDDTPANLALVTEFLEAQGLCVATAIDGEECLRCVELIRPDIILLDVVMPGLDGFEVARRLKLLSSVRDTPIIFMTALTGLHDKIRGFEAGGVDFVTKPLQIEEVKARVITHLRLHLSERGERAQRAAVEQRYQRLFEASTDGILLVDADTALVLDANPRMLQLIREKPAAILGARMWDLGAFLHLCDSASAFRDMVELSPHNAKECLLILGDSRQLDVEVTASTFRAGAIRVLQCNMRDVSERNQLRRRLLEATDREQLRLAREIHDGLGQELIGLDMLIHGMLKQVHRGQPPTATEIERMTATTRQALSTCHVIAHGLAPLSSTPGGLVEALQALKGRLSGPPGPSIDCQIELLCDVTASADACSHLYRIAQEAVANAIKHADARRVTISLSVDQKMLELKISDDGQGIGKIATGRRGLGFQTMRDRAANIGAMLILRVEPAGGTTVICQISQASRRSTHPPRR